VCGEGDTFPTAEVKRARITDKFNKLPRKHLEVQSFRAHFNKRYLCDEHSLEIDTGRDDGKTIGSLCRLSISPETQPSQLSTISKVNFSTT
jgi:hypothetical protein